MQKGARTGKQWKMRTEWPVAAAVRPAEYIGGWTWRDVVTITQAPRRIRNCAHNGGYIIWLANDRVAEKKRKKEQDQKRYGNMRAKNSKLHLLLKKFFAKLSKRSTNEERRNRIGYRMHCCNWKRCASSNVEWEWMVLQQKGNRMEKKEQREYSMWPEERNCADRLKSAVDEKQNVWNSVQKISNDSHVQKHKVIKNTYWKKHRHQWVRTKKKWATVKSYGDRWRYTRLTGQRRSIGVASVAHLCIQHQKSTVLNIY